MLIFLLRINFSFIWKICKLDSILVFSKTKEGYNSKSNEFNDLLNNRPVRLIRAKMEAD